MLFYKIKNIILIEIKHYKGMIRLEWLQNKMKVKKTLVWKYQFMRIQQK